MKTKFMSLVLCGTILLTTSCATLFTGTKQKVTFKSDMEGKVFQNLTEIGKTNEVLKIKRKDLVKLYTIKTEGCVEKQMELPIKSNHVFLLNLPFALFGYGLLWSYVDVMNGAQMKTDKIIEVHLDCKGKK